MKRHLALTLLLLLASLGSVLSRGADDDYVRIFNLIAEADSLTTTQSDQALARYRDAQAALQKFQKDSPNWSPDIVAFRLQYVTGKIAGLSSKTPALSPAPAVPPAVSSTPAVAAEAPATNETPASAVPPPSAPAMAQAPADWQLQLNSLNDQVHQLQADKSLLEAKVKEAFSARPAETDPRELARAQEKIKTLEKENDLLKVSLETEKKKPGSVNDPRTVEQLRQSLAQSTRELDAQKELVSKAALERDALQLRVKMLSSDMQDLAALRAENQLLKKNLADLQAASATSKSGEPARQLAEAQAQVAALQSDKELLQRKLGATVGSSVLPPVEESNRIKALEKERDDLQKRLAAANKSLYGRKGKGLNNEMEELAVQLTALRTRLDVYEARAVPYSAEELALMNQPAPKSAPAPTPAMNTGSKPLQELPPVTARLVAEARRSFQAGDYAKAESSYSEAVRQQSSAPMLADLANIQLEAGHVEAAEENIKKALALDPDSGYSLSVLGRLRFRQGKFDDAVEALGRAAKIEPRNAEIQNFLGLALSQKGLRAPAEAALRKALELEPSYASAHNNLAVIYITGKPPAMQLARWHYQRALAAGAPHNPELEKLLGLSQ